MDRIATISIASFRAFLRGRSLGAAVCLAMTLIPAASRAQVLIQRAREDLPAVRRISPVGVERGRAVEVLLEGERFVGLHAVLGPPGVRLARVVSIEEKQARVELEVAADAPLGAFPLHVLCKAGLSNPRMIRIDNLPQAAEVEPNNTSGASLRLSPPMAVDGVLTATDIDWFSFAAVAGQRLVFDVEAQRLGSALRPVLSLIDAQGRELKRSAAPSADIWPDTRLEYTFTQAGTYWLKLTDMTFQGADFGCYHLRIGSLPYATSLFPLGGRRGEQTTVTYSGGTLTEAVSALVDLGGDVAWNRTRLQTMTSTGDLLAPMLFAVGELPELVELEPNDAPDAAQPVDLPKTINGRLLAPGDRDCFRFHLAAGGQLVARVLAQELGSPLDSVLTLYDAEGKEVATADDRPLEGREPPVVRSLTPILPADDAQLAFTAQTEGDFSLAIEDRYGFGGPAFAYRLELAPLVQDYELMMQPGQATVGVAGQPAQQQQPQVLPEFAGVGCGALSVDRGGSATIHVRAVRGGYNGPIELTVLNLPPGLAAAPALIAAGQNDAIINLLADFEAASTASFVQIRGSAPLSVGNPSTEVGAPVRLASQPVVLSALPVNGVVQHDLATMAVGISEQGAELAVRGQLLSPLTPGGGAILRLTVKRREMIVGPVTVQLTSLPAGLAPVSLDVAADQESVETPLAAGLELTPGKHILLVQATLMLADRKEPIVAIFPLEFDALPIVTLEIATQQVDLPLVGEAAVELIVKRNGPAALPVELTFVGLPKGISAEPLAIPADAERFTLRLRAGEGATASPIRRIIQVKAKTKLGEQAVELPSLRFALKVVKP